VLDEVAEEMGREGTGAVKETTRPEYIFPDIFPTLNELLYGRYLRVLHKYKIQLKKWAIKNPGVSLFLSSSPFEYEQVMSEVSELSPFWLTVHPDSSPTNTTDLTDEGFDWSPELAQLLLRPQATEVRKKWEPVIWVHKQKSLQELAELAWKPGQPWPSGWFD